MPLQTRHRPRRWPLLPLAALGCSSSAPERDAAPGLASGPRASPRELTVSGSRLFFVADEGEHGREPWSVKQAAFQHRP